ncbi:hypothetical protein DPMN_097550 [Dreissena polymorpha]|uniref:Uncharacterized protein n=1 Tax=Dreissena polymorpha TaxID=45954 RepID=A0A9D4LAG7_DREPO|nr:hypothetical protein DPMN_097550 [Dreissena polymorpha]
MNSEHPGGHVFQQSGYIFIRNKCDLKSVNKFLHIRKNAPPPDIVGTNLVTKFHEDQTINVASRVKNAPATDIIGSNLLTKKNAPPHDIKRMNLLTKFHEDRTINVASREKCPAPGGHVFQATRTNFKLVQAIIAINLLTKFHEDWIINVASRVLTRKNVPPFGSHVFQANETFSNYSKISLRPIF